MFGLWEGAWAWVSPQRATPPTRGKKKEQVAFFSEIAAETAFWLPRGKKLFDLLQATLRNDRIIET